MKRATFILLFLSSVLLQGQSSFSDVEEFSHQMMMIVAEAAFTSSVDMEEGVIYIKVQPGDEIAIWDASGVVQGHWVIEKEHELDIQTHYLLEGRYFLGYNHPHVKPVVKPFDVGYDYLAFDTSDRNQ